MPRLSSVSLALIRSELLAGTSLNKISTRYGFQKSTLYYYYKQIKGKKFVAPNVTPTYSELEGEIVGIFAGDGSQHYSAKKSHYRVNVHFGLHAREYAEYVKRLYEGFFKKTFRLNTDVTIRVRTQSKDIFNYFKNYLAYDPWIKHVTVRLHTLNVPREFKIGFLRGLVDTDGMVKYRTERRRIRVAFYTTSIELHQQCRQMLTEFSFSYGAHTLLRENYKPIHIIQLHQASVIPFLNLVRPFKKRYVEQYLKEAPGSNPG
jgi:hypothetical protein